ncbi:MAG: Holliday junction branch migration protein RuvA [Alphaproteobacteria bacterium]|nr:Holliday junction branch migration protein RuvA [Alphaproteobacteria bacterium]
MIAKLKGIVDSIYEDCLILDVGGVGYLVAASSKTLSKLAKNQPTTLLIETVVREDAISLFGFSDAMEKEWFNTLTKIQGVGARVALSILSALSPIQLAQAVSAQDKASFSLASGVGPKLAARLVTELKGKIVTPPMGDINLEDLRSESFSITEAEPQKAESAALEDIISALVHLGYQRLEAYHTASKVCAENEDKPTAELIRLALKEFAKKDL